MALARKRQTFQNKRMTPVTWMRLPFRPSQQSPGSQHGGSTPWISQSRVESWQSSTQPGILVSSVALFRFWGLHKNISKASHSLGSWSASSLSKTSGEHRPDKGHCHLHFSPKNFMILQKTVSLIPLSFPRPTLQILQRTERHPPRLRSPD